jgi:hypothetical protein
MPEKGGLTPPFLRFTPFLFKFHIIESTLQLLLCFLELMMKQTGKKEIEIITK